MVGGCVNEYQGKGTLLVHGVRERGIGEKVVDKQGGDIKGFEGDGSDDEEKLAAVVAACKVDRKMDQIYVEVMFSSIWLGDMRDMSEHTTGGTVPKGATEDKSLIT